MDEEGVKDEAAATQEGESRENKSCVQTVSSNGEATAEKQTLSKRQKKKLLKQQKWEEERELRK